MHQYFKYIFGLPLLALLLSAGYANAIPGGTTIGGCLYSASGSVIYQDNGAGEVFPVFTTDYALNGFGGVSPNPNPAP